MKKLIIDVDAGVDDALARMADPPGPGASGGGAEEKKAVTALMKIGEP